jgi:hypothetical protein
MNSGYRSLCYTKGHEYVDYILQKETASEQAISLVKILEHWDTNTCHVGNFVVTGDVSDE